MRESLANVREHALQHTTTQKKVRTSNADAEVVSGVAVLAHDEDDGQDDRDEDRRDGDDDVGVNHFDCGGERGTCLVV